MELRCKKCDFNYTHLIATIQAEVDDNYKATSITVNGEAIPVDIGYEFRSQGNIHLLFQCENGHYFIISYDGHKGMTFIDQNPLMEQLAGYLNWKKRSLDFLQYNDRLLKAITAYFQEATKGQQKQGDQ